MTYFDESSSSVFTAVGVCVLSSFGVAVWEGGHDRSMCHHRADGISGPHTSPHAHDEAAPTPRPARGPAPHAAAQVMSLEAIAGGGVAGQALVKPWYALPRSLASTPAKRQGFTSAVVAPTRELSLQTLHTLKKLTTVAVQTERAMPSRSCHSWAAALRMRRSSNAPPDIAVGTPQTVATLLAAGLLPLADDEKCYPCAR